MWYTYIRFLGVGLSVLCDVNVISCESCISCSIYMQVFIQFYIYAGVLQDQNMSQILHL